MHQSSPALAAGVPSYQDEVPLLSVSSGTTNLLYHFAHLLLYKFAHLLL